MSARARRRAPRPGAAGSLPPTLAAAAGHNARWLAAGQGTRIALQLAGLLVLSRLLPPADFGLMAMVLAVTNFALLWRDLGTATALVRAPALSQALLSSVFWLNLAIGAALGAALVLARLPLAGALGDARLQPLLLWVALTFPLQGAAAVPQALLERAGRFQALAVIEAAAGGLALLAAVWAARAGWGAASLALQTLVWAAVSALAIGAVAGWRPTAQVSAKALRGVLGFSGHLTAFNLINYCTRNADSVVIGRVLGPQPLGAYSLAMRVTLFPVQNLTWAASRALLPVMSRTGPASGELAALYLRTVSLIAFFSAPLMAGLLALRADFVAVVLGPAWASVVPLLAWLAPVGFVQSVVSTVGPVFLSAGRSDTLMRLGLMSLVLIVGAFAVGVPFGIEAVAAAYLAANVLQAGPCLWVAARTLGLPLAAVLRCLVVPVWTALLMALLISGVQALLAGWGWPPLARLLAAAGVGGVLYLALAHACARRTLDDALRLAHLRRA